MAALAYPSPTNSSVPEAAQDTSAVSDHDLTARPARVPPIPASVTINVEGAFIVDEVPPQTNGHASEFVHYEHKDIRLPHHTDVVSHVAVDVRVASIRGSNMADNYFYRSVAPLLNSFISLVSLAPLWAVAG